MKINCFECVFCKSYKDGYTCVKHLQKKHIKNNTPCKNFVYHSHHKKEGLNNGRE